MRENADLLVQLGFYYCCFGLYISGGTVCEDKHCKKHKFDVAGVNALRAGNRTVHGVAVAGADEAASCAPALARKKQQAQELVSATRRLPTGINTSTVPYIDINGLIFLDWEFGAVNDMSCWTPLWRHVSAVLHSNGLELGFNVDNSQYSISDPQYKPGRYDFLWNFTSEQVEYSDFLTNMGSCPVSNHGFKPIVD